MISGDSAQDGGAETVPPGEAEDVERLRRERDAAVMALQTWQKRYEFLFSNMLTGYAYHEMVLDEDGEAIDYVFVEVNQTFEDLTGLSADDIVGKRVTEALPGIENSEFDWIGAYAKVAMAGETMQFEQFSEELERWYHVTAYSPGHATFVAVFHDITQHKATEEELARKREELVQSQKMELIGRLAGSIAHDFNNALTAMLGHAELLVESPDDRDEVTLRAGAISAAARQAAAMSHRLLAFSRSNVVHAERVDVEAALQTCLELMTPMLGERIHVRLEATDQPAAIDLDPGQLQRLLMNLLVNGADAMRGSGELNLGLRVFEVGQPLSGLAVGEVGLGKWVEIRVSDEGEGIPEALKERIFEPFFTTKADEGTGLGLPTVADVVRSAGGGIAVDSTVGEGSTFRVYLPWRPSPEGDASISGPLLLADPDRRELVLVEDQALIRNLLSGVLRKAGYRVRDFADAESALATDLGPVDVLVTDLVLPGRSGLELAEELRTVYGDLAVLFTSGFAGVEDVERQLDDPRVGFVQKPYRPSEVLAALGSVLSG